MASTSPRPPRPQAQSEAPAGVDAVSADQLPEVAAALYGCGFSVRTIATATGRGVKTVRRVLVASGTAIRPPGGHPPEPSPARITALPDGPASAIAHRLVVEGRSARRAWKPWEKPPDADSWSAVFRTALDRGPVVGIAATAAEHLGRQPTRLELDAARRAARRLAANGELALSREVLTAGGRRQRQWALRRLGTPAGVDPAPDGRWSPARPGLDQIGAARHFTRRLRALSRAAALLETSALDPATTAELRHTVEATIANLDELRARVCAARRPMS